LVVGSGNLDGSYVRRPLRRVCSLVGGQMIEQEMEEKRKRGRPKKQIVTKKTEDAYKLTPAHAFYESCKAGGESALNDLGCGHYIGVHRKRVSNATESGVDTAIIIFPVFTSVGGELLRRPNYFVKAGKKYCLWEQSTIEMDLALKVAHAIIRVAGGSVAQEDKKEVRALDGAIVDEKREALKTEIKEDLSAFDI